MNNNGKKDYGTVVDRIRPELKAAIDQFPPINYDYDSILMQRDGSKFYEEHPEFLPVDPVVKVENRIISVPGNDQLEVRIYEPVEKGENLPGILWLHGGGMCLGFTKADDGQNIRFVNEVPAVVVSVEYRLAPENPYPIPGDDCYGALVWFYENAASLGVNPDKIAIAGASGGAGLAIYVALKARDNCYPPIEFIMANSPMISRDMTTDSASRVYDPRTLNKEGVESLWGFYLNHAKETDAYMEPAKADFSGFPAVYTMAGDLDPFRDETIAFATKLLKANVPTELHIYSGCFHVCESLAPQAEISKYIISEMIRAFRERLVK